MFFTFRPLGEMFYVNSLHYWLPLPPFFGCELSVQENIVPQFVTCKTKQVGKREKEVTQMF